MERYITVKGSAHVTAKPDMVVISMSLESRDMDYAKAMKKASAGIDEITRTLADAGFEKEDIKTTDFDADTVYESVKQRDGDYRRVFQGYRVRHDLKLEFGLDTDRLAKTLYAISLCPSHPEFSISFTVNDAAGIKEELLRFAAVNARKKAEILCDASGVSLGKLVNIDYSWSDINIYSATRFSLPPSYLAEDDYVGMNIEPDDIDVSDSVTFTWEIDQR